MSQIDDSVKAPAVTAVFIAIAEVTSRNALTYDEWLSVVTDKFVRAWKVIDP